MFYDCPAGTFNVINKNQSLSDIAKNNSITTNELLQSNAFLNPSYYLAGQVIVIPCDGDISKGIYTVGEGETLCDVLRKSNASAAEIISLNPKTDIFDLHNGDKLNIPLKKIRRGEYHTIKAGESIKDISEKFGVTQLELLRLNPNLRPSEFTAGQTIRINNN